MSDEAASCPHCQSLLINSSPNRPCTEIEAWQWMRCTSCDWQGASPFRGSSPLRGAPPSFCVSCAEPKTDSTAWLCEACLDWRPTRREYFAGLCFPAAWMRAHDPVDPGYDEPARAAKWACEMADALIAELDKP